MMACVADRLLAAPFATLGSIGATTSVPVLNVEKLLTRWGIRAYAVRSGKHKGGGPVLVGDARADQDALAKLQDDLARVHGAFKSHVARFRAMVDVDAVGTGEVGGWVSGVGVFLGGLSLLGSFLWPWFPCRQINPCFQTTLT
jgi:serine protease SohB